MVNQPIVQNLLALADAYSRRTGLSMPTVSRHFYGNQGFFDDLRAGKQTVSTRKVDEILSTFAERWPVGLAWPKTAPISMRRPRK